jgi:hypothetical protein
MLFFTIAMKSPPQSHLMLQSSIKCANSHHFSNRPEADFLMGVSGTRDLAKRLKVDPPA